MSLRPLSFSAQKPSSSSKPNNYDVQTGFRTLSIHVNDTLRESAKPTGKLGAAGVSAIRQIDVHRIDPEEVFARFSTSPTLGLEQAAVDRRSATGKNVISPPPTQYWKKALNYVFGGFNFLMWIAFIVTILSYKPLGEPNPAIFNLGVAVLLIIVITVSATFYALVDWNASRIMKSIKSLIAAEATVVRDGRQQTIAAADVVVGDLVVLSMGDRVPSDLRLVETSTDLKFDRSLLTGESDPVPGVVAFTSDNALETRNLALTSTFVIQGACTGVTFAIGDRSIMGRIVAMSGADKFKLTTVQKEVWFFTKIISSVALFFFCLSMIVWATWIRKRYPSFETASIAIINSIGCLTACVPQGLPVCVALSLTIIAKRMAKRSVLVKNLATVETLGCMSVLCTDKTGTLTEGKMSVQNCAFLDSQHRVHDISEALNQPAGPNTPQGFKALWRIARLCNGATFDAKTQSLPIEQRVAKGNATDVALLKFAESVLLPIADGDVVHDKLFEIPFNSTNKWMMTIVRERRIDGPANDVDPLMLIKGGPDVLFPYCTNVLSADGTVTPLDGPSLEQLSRVQAEWSSQGQRVLALCMRTLQAIKVDPQHVNANDMEGLMYSELQNLTLVGLVGIQDPPRSNVEGAVRLIKRAGVRIFMVTGDFTLTAVAIARNVGIVTQEKVDGIDELRASESAKRFRGAPPADIKPSEGDALRALVLTGDDVDHFAPEDWDALVGNYTEVVFARTTPEQKLKIVEEIKARGDNTVAVTGDGVNDAPALKASDIGVAMGSGSDVAKEAASMILMNNDFASIPVAIEMGRLVFDNLKKVILYLMPAGTYTQLIAVFSNVFLGMQIPLSSYLQVCFSITNDVVMSISLMYEKAEADLMLRTPRNARTDRLTDWRFFFQIYLFLGLMIWPCAMSMWFLYMSQQGFGFYDVLLAYNKWTDGYKNHTAAELAHFVSVGQCIYYVTMVFMQYGILLAVRNRRFSTFNSNPLWGPRRNLAVPLGMIATALIAVTNLYGPGLRRVFGTAAIPGMFWGLPFAFAVGVLSVDEGRKAIVRMYPKSFVAKMAW